MNRAAIHRKHALYSGSAVVRQGRSTGPDLQNCCPLNFLLHQRADLPTRRLPRVFHADGYTMVEEVAAVDIRCE